VLLSLAVAFPSFRDWSCGFGGEHERQTRLQAKATFQWLSRCSISRMRSMLGGCYTLQYPESRSSLASVYEMEVTACMAKLSQASAKSSMADVASSHGWLVCAPTVNVDTYIVLDMYCDVSRDDEERTAKADGHLWWHSGPRQYTLVGMSVGHRNLTSR
jgi:hypothetical protein